MIDRYTQSEFKKFWSDEAKIQRWLAVELAVLEVQEQKRIVPRGTAAQIRSRGKIDLKRMTEIEQVTRHDVLAFTQMIAESVGRERARYFHFGLTSSDVVDTSFALALRDAGQIICTELVQLRKVLWRAAIRTKKIPTIGRTHGVHAEPTSFGLKFLGWYTQFSRLESRFRNAISEIEFGKVSGAVGSYGAIDPEVEKKALGKLGLKVEPVSTQVVPRDRHARYFNAIAEIGAGIERVAIDLRNLQRTEVGEIEEGFSKGQKGSSAMPHKKNPISAENLCGCARVLRGYAGAALENVALWHERDISHSSVERVIAPDATALCHYMLRRLRELVSGVQINEAMVLRNLEMTMGVVYSGHVLLALVEKGMSREDAYVVVQDAATEAWTKKKPLREILAKRAAVSAILSRQELQRIFDVKKFLVHVGAIFERVQSTIYFEDVSKKTRKAKKKPATIRGRSGRR